MATSKKSEKCPAEDYSYEEYSYEKAIEKLEEILNKLDGGQLPLEESMDKFEEGMKLVLHCEEILKAYERRITKLTGIRDGEIMEEEIEL